MVRWRLPRAGSDTKDEMEHASSSSDPPPEYPRPRLPLRRCLDGDGDGRRAGTSQLAVPLSALNQYLGREEEGGKVW